MRLRLSSNEMVFSLHEFRSLNVSDLCRRYGWGEEGEWLDRSRNEQAEQEVERGLT